MTTESHTALLVGAQQSLRSLPRAQREQIGAALEKLGQTVSAMMACKRTPRKFKERKPQ